MQLHFLFIVITKEAKKKKKRGQTKEGLVTKKKIHTQSKTLTHSQTEVTPIAKNLPPLHPFQQWMAKRLERQSPWTILSEVGHSRS